MRNKILALSTSALLALSVGLAQNTPATPATPATPQTPATTTGQVDQLGAQIQAMQQYISANKANITKEQAQKLLPYFMAIRDTAAFTESTASFYLSNIAGLLTPEQIAATNWPSATAQGAAAGNTNQNNAGAAGGNTNNNAAGNNAGGNTNDQNNQNNAGGNTNNQNNAGAGGNTNDQNNAGAAGGNAGQGGNAAQTPATTAMSPSNPYSQAPYSDALNQIISTLMQIAYGTASTQ